MKEIKFPAWKKIQYIHGNVVFTLFPLLVFDLYEPGTSLSRRDACAGAPSVECQCERHSSGLN